MSNLLQTPIGQLSPVGDYGRKNAQALSGVSGLWDAHFAQALADLTANSAAPDHAGEPNLDGATPAPVDTTPLQNGSPILPFIKNQLGCAVQQTEVNPPRHLPLPIAELDLSLLDAPREPFPAQTLSDQQTQLAVDQRWHRPVVLNTLAELPSSTRVQEPRPLHLPLAELELHLLPKPAEPFEPATLAAQQRQLAYENGCLRPLLNRQAA